MQVFFYNLKNKLEKAVKTTPSNGLCLSRLP